METVLVKTATIGKASKENHQLRNTPRKREEEKRKLREKGTEGNCGCICTIPDATNRVKNKFEDSRVN